jgi:PBSX family phage terminase large subunit
MYSLHFGFDDNLSLPDSYKEALKREHVGLWYKRFILGLWVLAEGAVYDFFDEAEPYVLAPEGLPEARYKAVACDYGTGNPTSFGLFGVNQYARPRCWLEREWYWDSKKQGRQKTDSEYADALEEWLGDDRPRFVLVDPSASSFKEELRRRRLMVRDADNDVLEGIRTQANMLRNGEYAMSSMCRQNIEDYYAYVWDKRAQERGEDKPIKQNDHTKDRERYFLHTLFGKKHIDWERLTKR